MKQMRLLILGLGLLMLSVRSLGAALLRTAKAEIEPSTNQTLNSAPYAESTGVIPVKEWGCHPDEPELNPVNIQKVKEDFALWSSKENRVFPNSIRIFSFGDTAWYICNCKTWYYDPAPIEELDDAQNIITRYCGRNRSGWVWSKKWNKGYNIVSFEFVKFAMHERLCPKHCFT
ncbi:hypothetical protein F4809DRAFT_601810 [Biscogniauxia mediterranea]|nr:hypothetical protein F4809DRAFT_601810 [Biscogniauxia mediterranea]